MRKWQSETLAMIKSIDTIGIINLLFFKHLQDDHILIKDTLERFYKLYRKSYE